MTTITPTTSIKSSISFYIKPKSLSEYGSKDIFKFYLLSSGEGDREWCYVSKRWLLHRSIRHVKSLKRTLYSLPKTILISPYTPLHDVNVTSIYSNTRTHILIFLYKTNLCFDLWAEEGRNRCSFLPPYVSVKNPHLFLLPTHSNDYYNTYHQYKK